MGPSTVRPVRGGSPGSLPPPTRRKSVLVMGSRQGAVRRPLGAAPRLSARSPPNPRRPRSTPPCGRRGAPQRSIPPRPRSTFCANHCSLIPARPAVLSSSARPGSRSRNTLTKRSTQSSRSSFAASTCSSRSFFAWSRSVLAAVRSVVRVFKSVQAWSRSAVRVFKSAARRSRARPYCHLTVRAAAAVADPDGFSPDRPTVGGGVDDSGTTGREGNQPPSPARS